MSAIDRVTCGFLFLVGWVSGGGILALLSMEALSAIGVTGLNNAFVSGCLWGTWGVVMGRWMGRYWLNNMRQQQGGRAHG